MTRDHLSMMAGVTPAGNLYTLVRREGLSSSESVVFLKHLLVQTGKKLLVSWDGSLFLNLAEIEELLDHVRVHAHARYIYIMFCTAANTGARRSEMLRSRIEDFDFAVGCVTTRKKSGTGPWG
ncbi:MAG: site-specific integrase [Gemmataceae bacterium]|nr:site-specific integrase [Gemmataceae bacterium]